MRSGAIAFRLGIEISRVLSLRLRRTSGAAQPDAGEAADEPADEPVDEPAGPSAAEGS